jgi:RNA polymerase sigma factor (sigma-70 family)
MKIKREPNKRKPIREIQTRKNFSGEASPYWDHIMNRQRQTDEGNPVEDTLANPDVLSETETLHGRPLTERGELQYEVLQEVLPTLTDRQREAIRLCGLEGLAEEKAASILGIKRRTLRTMLTRIRAKIKRVYEVRVKAEQ